MKTDEKGAKTMGRDIDKLVAELVLGCKPVQGTPSNEWFCGCGQTCSYPHADGDRDSQLYGILSGYSTDMAAAWEVVEHLRRQDWEMTLSVNHYVTAPWDCRLFLMLPTSPDAPTERVIAHGETASLAICEAALKAVAARGKVD